jgi:hypothetical protein
MSQSYDLVRKTLVKASRADWVSREAEQRFLPPFFWLFLVLFLATSSPRPGGAGE